MELPEDPDYILNPYLHTTSVPQLFYQSPQGWPGLTRAILVKYMQATQRGVITPT